MEIQENPIIEIQGTGVKLDDLFVFRKPKIESHDFFTYMQIDLSMIKFGFDFETDLDKIKLNEKKSIVYLNCKDQTKSIVRQINKNTVFLNDQLNGREKLLVGEFCASMSDLENALTKVEMLDVVEKRLNSEGDLSGIIKDAGVALTQMKSEIHQGMKRVAASEGNKTILRLQEGIHKLYEEQRMGGASYGIVDYFDKEDTEKKQPKIKYVISNPASQLVEERTISKRITDTKSVSMGKYYYLEGIDGILVKRALKELDDLRFDINQSNKGMYDKIKAFRQREEEFEKNKENTIFGFRYDLYDKSRNNKKFKRNKEKWFLKWYYNIFRDIRETEIGIKRFEREIERRMIGLKGTEKGLTESENPEFYMDKKIFEKYKRITEQPPKQEGEPSENKKSEYLPEKIVEEFFGHKDGKKNNGAFAAVFSNYKDRFKENLEYHVSRFKEIVAFHLAKKGLKINKDEEPEKLKFYDSIEKKVLEDFEELRNPIDYVVGKNGKTVLLLCEDYSGLPVNEDEVPATVYREIEYTPQTPQKERRIARKIVYGLATIAGLLLVGNIAQGYLTVRSHPGRKGQNITLIEGVQKTIGDVAQSVRSLTGEEKTSLTEKLAEKDSTIAEKNNTIVVLSQVRINQELGISDTAKEENKRKLEEMLENYNPKNKIMIQSWKNLKGIMPTVENVLDAYMKNGNIELLKDTVIYSGRIDSSMTYKAYISLVDKCDFLKANKLNREFGPVNINIKDKTRFMESYSLEPSFWQLVGANHNFTDMDNYDSFKEWAEYSEDYKIVFKKK